MKIGIVGSRHFFDYHEIVNKLTNEVRPSDTIVSGGAPGVDTLAVRFAREYTTNDPFIFAPDPDEIRKFGFRFAARKRNGLIAQWSYILFAFPCICSTGTWNAIWQFTQQPGKNFAPVVTKVKCGP